MLRPDAVELAADRRSSVGRRRARILPISAMIGTEISSASSSRVSMRWFTRSTTMHEPDAEQQPDQARAARRGTAATPAPRSAASRRLGAPPGRASLYGARCETLELELRRALLRLCAAACDQPVALGDQRVDRLGSAAAATSPRMMNPFSSSNASSRRSRLVERARQLLELALVLAAQLGVHDLEERGGERLDDLGGTLGVDVVDDELGSSCCRCRATRDTLPGELVGIAPAAPSSSAARSGTSPRLTLSASWGHVGRVARTGGWRR